MKRQRKKASEYLTKYRTRYRTRYELNSIPSHHSFIQKRKKKLWDIELLHPLFRALRMDNSNSIVHFYDFFVVTFFFPDFREKVQARRMVWPGVSVVLRLLCRRKLYRWEWMWWHGTRVWWSQWRMRASGFSSISMIILNFSNEENRKLRVKMVDFFSFLLPQ